MPRRPFGSRIDRTVRLSASTDSGPGPTRYPKHSPHGGGPAATPEPSPAAAVLAMTSVRDRTADAAAAVRLANRPDGAPVSEHRFPGRVRRVSRNTALTGAALPPPPPSPAAAVLAMTSVGDRAADAEAAVRLANRPPPCRGESLGQVPNSVTTVRQSAPSSLGPGLEGCLRTAV